MGKKPTMLVERDNIVMGAVGEEVSESSRFHYHILFVIALNSFPCENLQVSFIFRRVDAIPYRLQVASSK